MSTPRSRAPRSGVLGAGPTRVLAAALLGLACGLSGCAGQRLDSLEARVADQTLELRALRARDAGTKVPVEVYARSLKEPAPDLRPELEALRIQILRLEAELADLRNRRPSTAIQDPPAVGEVLIPRPGQRVAPRAGVEIEVISVGAGNLLLGRVAGELERLTLAGVDAPRRTEEYREDPSLKARHAAAFGLACVESDTGWALSRDFLFARVRGKRFALRYARRGRATDGSLSVILSEGSTDLNAALVSAGLAVAKGDTYRRQEAEARKAKRGLFALPK